MVRSGAWWRKWRVLVLTTVAATAVLGVLAVAWYSPHPRSAGPPDATGQPPTSVDRIQGFDIIVSYSTTNISDTSYLHSPECDLCPLSVTPGHTWVASFDLMNGDRSRAHTVTGLSIDSPFTVESSSPSFPVTIAPGGSLSFSITMSSPTSPGYYFVTGSLQTD